MIRGVTNKSVFVDGRVSIIFPTEFISMKILNNQFVRSEKLIVNRYTFLNINSIVLRPNLFISKERNGVLYCYSCS